MPPPTAVQNGEQAAQEKPQAHDEIPRGVSAAEELKKSLGGPPTFADPHAERAYLKGRLAAGLRVFGKLGYEAGVAGHITVRDPIERDTFWVNPLGVAFRAMRRSDLIRVNAKGEVVDGGAVRRLNTAAYMIHHAVHTARPDVQCAAHSHSIYGRAFSALGRELDITTQDACAFYKVRGPSELCNVTAGSQRPRGCVGPRSLPHVQWDRAGQGRGRGDRARLGRQKSRHSAEPWPVDGWCIGGGGRLVVQRSGLSPSLYLHNSYTATTDGLEGYVLPSAAPG